LQVNFRPWHDQHAGLSFFKVECSSTNFAVCVVGFKVMDALWHFAQDSGGLIWLWQVRQSAMPGKCAFRSETVSDCSIP
jgi:hypothetical protein